MHGRDLRIPGLLRDIKIAAERTGVAIRDHLRMAGLALGTPCTATVCGPHEVWTNLQGEVV